MNQSELCNNSLCSKVPTKEFTRCGENVIKSNHFDKIIQETPTRIPF